VSEEADKRIEAARVDAQRAKETEEFLKGLKKGDSTVKAIHNPEAWVMRDKAKGAAARGEMSRQMDCPHPIEYMQQYFDDDPGVKRSGKDLNLFVCAQCGCLLWIVDPFGKVAADG